MRPSWLKLREVLPQARKFYEAGSSELIIFDVNLHHQNPIEWRLWQSLGNRDELAEIERRTSFGIDLTEITKLNNMVIDRYPPLWAW